MEQWSPVSFDSIDGWSGDDHLAALSCFRVSARAIVSSKAESRVAVRPSKDLVNLARKALDLDIAALSGAKARAFFEKHFLPHELKGELGFVTAYFEPEVEASRTKSSEFPAPLYKRPDDVVKLTDDIRPANLDPDLEYARQTADGLVEYYDRDAIRKGVLDGQGLELFWLKSRIEAFYIHVQGSARLKFQDGTTTRVSYAGKTGHPYTSIARVLVRRGDMTVEQANMQTIRAWLEADTDRADELLKYNRSFIFFSEVTDSDPQFGPRAAAGVQLTPGRSLAIDRTVHPYGTPIWLATEKPLPHSSRPFRRLMIAQDTGSAIVGPQRGDIFLGSGDEAGLVAGSVRHTTRFLAFLPGGSG